MNQPLTQHRTQVYLPGHLYQKAKRIAKRGEMSLAEVVRMAIDQYVESQTEVKTKDFEKARVEFLKLAGMFKGPKDLAINHDNYW